MHYVICKGESMRITTSKSKNYEPFYITKSFVDRNGKSTFRIVRKLGTLSDLSEMLNTDRSDGPVHGR